MAACSFHVVAMGAKRSCESRGAVTGGGPDRKLRLLVVSRVDDCMRGGEYDGRSRSLYFT